MGSSGVHRGLWDSRSPRDRSLLGQKSCPSKHVYPQAKGTDAELAPIPSLGFWGGFFPSVELRFWFILAFGLLHGMNSLASALRHWSSQCLFLLIKIFPSVHVRTWPSGHLTNFRKKKQYKLFLVPDWKASFSAFLTLFLTTPNLLCCFWGADIRTRLNFPWSSKWHHTQR